MHIHNINVVCLYIIYIQITPVDGMAGSFFSPRRLLFRRRRRCRGLIKGQEVMNENCL